MDIESLGIDVEDLHTTLRQGLQTVREFQSPVPDIVIQRLSKNTGEPTEIGVIHAISIKFAVREREIATGDPIETDFSDGDMKIPAHGLIPKAGDMFVWDGHTVEITKVYPQKLFTVVCEIRLVN